MKISCFLLDNSDNACTLTIDWLNLLCWIDTKFLTAKHIDFYWNFRICVYLDRFYMKKASMFSFYTYCVKCSHLFCFIVVVWNFRTLVYWFLVLRIFWKTWDIAGKFFVSSVRRNESFYFFVRKYMKQHIEILLNKFLHSFLTPQSEIATKNLWRHML